MSFGKRLKQARLNKKLTQESLGSMIGVAKSTITGYEKGTSHPDENKIISLMAVLDIDANFLWQDDLQQKSAAAPDGTEADKSFNDFYALLLNSGIIKPGQNLTKLQSDFLYHQIKAIIAVLDGGK